MSIGIDLKWVTSPYSLPENSGIRIRITVECATGVSQNIFAYRMLPTNPATGSQEAYFDHVCSPSDLEDYPENAPISGMLPQWFRLNYIDVLVRSAAEAENLIDKVKEDVLQLKNTLTTMETLTNESTISYGITCDTEEDIPTSSSSSAAPESPESASIGDLESVEVESTFSLSPNDPSELWSIETDSVSVNIPPRSVSPQLISCGFDFSSVPSDSVIKGIEVTIYDDTGSSSSVSLGNSEFEYLSLYDPILGPVGDNKNTEAYFNEVIGSSSDLWGATLDRSKLNYGTFGILFSFDNNDYTAWKNITITSITMKLYYQQVYS